MLIGDSAWPDFVDWMGRQSILGVDTETTGLHPFHGDRIAGVSVANHRAGFYIPFYHGEGYNHPNSRFHQLLRMIEKVPRIVMFNGTFDLNFLMTAGMKAPLPGHYEEVQVAAHLHNENDFNKFTGRRAGLKELADKYLGEGASMEEETLRERVAMRFGKAKANTKAWKGLMWHLPATIVERYATADAVLTLNLREYFIEYLIKQHMTGLYREMCDYTLLLQQIVFDGMRIDRDLCEKFYIETKRDSESAAFDFRNLSGNPNLNLNSSPQLHELFREKKVTKEELKRWASEEANSMNLETAEEGEWISHRSELARCLQRFRTVYKMHSSYFAAYLPLLDANDRLHTNLNVTGAETGRLSCNNPNLQAIPRGDSPEKEKVKLIFIPDEEGDLGVEMDYAQAEMRLASFYGREFTMAGILESGVDMHQATADLVKCDRDTAKRINFSAIYGIGAHKFSTTYDVPFQESVMHLENYHAAYPGFRDLYRRAEQIAAERRVLVLPSGRRRHYGLPMGKLIDDHSVSQIKMMNGNLMMDVHKASSNLVQGMVAAVMMKSMLRVWQELPDLQMRLTVHDSLLFNIKEGLSRSATDELIAQAKNIMEDPAPDDPAFRFYNVPGHPNCRMKVDVKTFDERWGEATKWQP